MNTSFQSLPLNLPIPKDDRLCNHLLGMKIPKIALQNTRGIAKNLLSYSKKIQIFYFYPMIGKPDTPLPPNWDNIPGARGCTPQNLSFNKKIKEITNYSAEIIGISTQSVEDLEEASNRLDISQELLSDENLLLTKLLLLPTFEIEKKNYIKRITLIAENNIIQKYFYPIFPPDKHIFEVLEWFQEKNK